MIPVGSQSYSDQFGSPSAKVLAFLRGRCVGTQKQTVVPPGFLNAHYTLGQATYGPDPAQTDPAVRGPLTVCRGVWDTRWPEYKSLDYLFLRSQVAGAPRIRCSTEKWNLLNVSEPQCRSRIVADMLTDIAAVPGTGGVFLDELIPLTQAHIDQADPRFYGSANADPAIWGGVSWLRQQQLWLDYVVSALHNRGLFVIANQGHLCLGWAPPLTGADCTMVEQFCNRNLVGDWKLMMDRCSALPCLILQSDVGEVDRGLFFASAMFLDNAFVNFTDGDSVGEFWWPEMELARAALGKPLSKWGANGPMYTRVFANGTVFANPGTVSQTVPGRVAVFQGGGRLTDANIDGNGKYVGGTMTAGGSTVPAGSGAVVLNTVVAPILTLTLPTGERYNVPMVPA